ncbi:MAG: hypothetical protein IKS41_03720 [Alphaproteobacteria bacterium]|nr:hypothetical protein [Alphaproteobacteria bacterium]
MQNMETILKTTLKCLLALTCLLLWGFYYVKTHQPDFYEIAYKDTSLMVKYLNGESLTFLKQNYPPRTKKIVAYLPDLANTNCPYMKDFVKALYMAKSDPKWYQYYDFAPQVNSVEAETRSESEKKIKQLRNFIENICGNICIISTQENWVFSVQQGDLLETSLEEFK